MEDALAEGRREGIVGRLLMKVGITMSSSREFLPSNFADLVRVLGALAAVGFLARGTRTGTSVVTANTEGTSTTEGTGITVCATGAKGKCCTKGVKAN
jgi:hypothetical protein